jgi:hypothetical protein
MTPNDQQPEELLRELTLLRALLEEEIAKRKAIAARARKYLAERNEAREEAARHLQWRRALEVLNRWLKADLALLAASDERV